MKATRPEGLGPRGRWCRVHGRRAHRMSGERDRVRHRGARGRRRRSAPAGQVVSGRRAVAEAIRSGRVTEVLVVSSPTVTQGIRVVLEAAEARDVPVRTVPRATLDALADEHRGVVARVDAVANDTLSEHDLATFPFAPGRARRGARRHRRPAEPRCGGQVGRGGRRSDARHAHAPGSRGHAGGRACVGGRARAPSSRAGRQHRPRGRTAARERGSGSSVSTSGARFPSTTRRARRGGSPS